MDQCYPMFCKSKAYGALGLLIETEGIPPEMIIAGMKDMKFCEFAGKCREVLCHWHSTKPYSTLSHPAEHEIRELKKGAARNLTW